MRAAFTRIALIVPCHTVGGCQRHVSHTPAMCGATCASLTKSILSCSRHPVNTAACDHAVCSALHRVPAWTLAQFNAPKRHIWPIPGTIVLPIAAVPCHGSDRGGTHRGCALLRGSGLRAQATCVGRRGSAISRQTQRPDPPPSSRPSPAHPPPPPSLGCRTG